MLQKKSFNLLNEEDTKTTKTPYCRWLRFLVVPSLICFALLLILVNVDFSGKAGNSDSTTTTPNEALKSTIKTEQPPNIVRERSIATKDARSFGNMCEQINGNKCKIKCTAMSTDQKELNKQLAQQYQECNSPLDLRLEMSSFKDSTFKNADLNGNFVLVNLTLWECFLDKIADNAFNKDSTRHLESLVIEPAKLEKISEKTFAGLENIKYFTMINTPGWGTLAGKALVKPMATTLREFTFQHRSFQTQYDPGDWLQGADLIELRKVDFKGNTFTNTLKKSSFVTLKRVEILSLESCKIETLQDDTFDSIMDTLEYLVLSQNNLKILSPYLINTLTGSNVELTLESNYWDCTCDNFEMIEAVKHGEIKLNTEPMCYQPPDLYGMEIKQLKLCCAENEDECLEETTTAIATTTTTTVTPTTTTTTMPTTTTTTTIPTTTTTTMPTTTPITSTENSAESCKTVQLKCKRPFAEEDPLKYDVKDRYAYFEIKTTTDTSVTLTIHAIPADGKLLYYMNQDDDTYKYQKLEHLLSVNDLVADESYVFCLVPFEVEMMSPFNCRAHHMGQLEFVDPWQNRSAMALFITLSSVGVVVFLMLGCISVYLMLRWRPTLLGESKRLVKLAPDSKQVFLKRSHSTLPTDETYEALRTYAAAPLVDSNDYMKYYSSLELSSANVQTSPTDNLPPHMRAPALPPLQTLRPVSAQSTIPADEITSLEKLPDHFNEHEYQSLEEYQEVYEISYA